MSVANLGAGLMQGFAVDASLGKSAANDSAGGQSQMSAIIAAGLTILVALYLTPLFRNLPEATLAVIVIHAVWSLFDVAELQQDLAGEDIQLWLAGFHGRVGPTLEISHLVDVIGADHIYPTVHDAANVYKGSFNGRTGNRNQ